MKLKKYFFWILLSIICDLFILYGWIKEIGWMIPVFWGASFIFVSIAVCIEAENIEIVNNLWDDLDSLKQKVSNLDDTVFKLRLDDAKKQDEAEKMDRYVTKTYDPKTGKVTLDFDPPLCPYANTITRIKVKEKDKEKEDYWVDKYPR